MMTQEEFSAAFKHSPMKRVLRLRSGQAPLRGLKRNACVVLGNVGTAEARPRGVWAPLTLNHGSGCSFSGHEASPVTVA